MLELRDAVKRYGPRTVLTIDALKLERGERVALVGPNGSGKSTLLRILACVEPLTEGTVSLDGRPVRSAAERQAARRRVTLVEQAPFLFRGTVLDNVTFPLRARGLAADALLARAALARFGAESLAQRDAHTLSGGETQRVALARAVAADPAVLLLDEPTSAADREVRAAVAEAVNSLAAERGVAVCVATHQIEDAYRWSDRIVTLQGGALSPVVPENCFRVLLPGGSGVQRVAVGPVAFDVMSDRSGPAVLLVPPEEIVLSEAPLHSSARNTVPGRIVRVSEQGDAVRVTIDAGVELVALVTRASYEALGLGLGRQVVASFKSVAVRVV